MKIDTFQADYSVNGMPCHKYIIRNLKNERDVVVFEKAFIETMLSYSFPETAISDALELLPRFALRNGPIWGQSFNLTGDGVDMGNLLSTLCLDSSIPHYSCKEYYALFDESCSACKHCIFSTNYKNVHSAEERIILRYMLQSAQNLERMKDRGLKAGLFHSVEDAVAMVASASHPVNYLFLRTVYKTLNASAARYYSSQDAGVSLGAKIRTKLADDIYRASLPAECYQNGWHNKLIEAWEEDLFREPPCNDTVADDCLALMAAKTKYIPPAISKLKEAPRRKPVRASSGSSSATSTADAAPKRTISVPEPKKIKERYSTSATTGSVDLPLPDKHSQESPVPISDPPEPSVSDTSPVIEMPSPSVDNTSEHGSVDSSKQTSGAALSVEYIEVVNNDDFSHEPSIQVDNRIVEKYDTFPRELDMHGNLIYTPSVTKRELLDCAINLDTATVLDLTAFENAVLKDMRLPLEVVFDEFHSVYLLLWVPSMHTFFYTDFSRDMSNEILFSVLSRRSIIKITYSPYWLYSIVYQRNHGQLRSLESIQTLHYLLHNDSLDYIGALLAYGISPATAGVDFLSRGTALSVVFRLLPRYGIIYRKQSRAISRKNLQDRYDELCGFNEAVGISYDMHYWFGLDEFLFVMPHPFFFKFKNVDLWKVSVPGYILSYRVSYGKEPPEPLFRKLLYALASTGRFRSLRMQLMDVSELTMTIFVLEQHFPVALELINRTMFDIVEGLQEYGISFETKYRLVEHRRISG